MRFMVTVLLAAVLALSGIATYQFDQLGANRNDARIQTCQAFQAENAALVKIIRQGEKALAGFAYYRDHPAERAVALANDQAAIRTIRAGVPTYC